MTEHISVIGQTVLLGSKAPIAEIPGVRVLPAQPGTTYPAQQVPSSITAEEVTWSRLGPDEAFNVILHRQGLRLELIECVWDEASQDWTNRTLTDTAALNLTVYLP